MGQLMLLRRNFKLLFLRNRTAFMKKTKKTDTFAGLSEKQLEKDKKKKKKKKSLLHA
jgi:hypothetical protein